MAQRSGHLGIFVLQASATVAVVVHGRRSGEGSAWQTLIAPVAAFVGICVIVVLALRNWSLLSGATGGLSSMLPWLIPAAASRGALMATLRADRVGSLNPPERTDADAVETDSAEATTPINDK